MATTLSSRELGMLLHLKKRQAELEFKKYIVKKDEEKTQEIKVELEAVNRGAERILSKMNEKNVRLVVPFLDEIKKYEKKLSSLSKEKIIEALRSKTGEVYESLEQKSKLIKSNLEQKDDIGRLNVFLYRIPEDIRKKLIPHIQKGRIQEEIEIDERIGENLAILLRRIGIPAEFDLTRKVLSSSIEPHREKKFIVNNRVVWISESFDSLFEKNERNLKEVGMKLQLKNAERQIREFGEAESIEFETFQQGYMEFLALRNKMLEVFSNSDEIL